MTLRTRRLMLLLLAVLAAVTTGTSLFAALLGISAGIGFPKIAFAPVSFTTYTAATGTLNVTAQPVDIDLGPPLGKRAITGAKSLTINLTLDTTGVVTGPYTATDLALTGNIDLNGDLVPDYSGVLLTGRIVSFGFANLGTNAFFDFRFTPTGGALVNAGYFSGKDIGVVATSEGSTFTGDFTANFTGNAKGILGSIALCPGKIGDFVWNDTDRDGIQDPGEPGINGVTVKLMNSANLVIATTTTTVGPFGGDGYYAFEGVCGGSYHVALDLATVPPGFVPSPTGQGGNPTSDSNVNPSNVSLPNNSAQDLTIDFGFNRPCSGRIGDFVWNDGDRDGIQDAGETGIVGVTVNLRNGLTNALLATTTTGFNGSYSFDNLCAGSYLVEVDLTTVPPGFVPSTTLAGGDTADDSNPNPAAVTLTDDFTTDLTIDFGFNLPCAGDIGDSVWFDSNANGVQDPGEDGLDGVTVRLIEDATSTVLASDITGPNGYYVFKGRCAGTYRVEVDTTTVPSTYVPSPTLATSVDKDSNPNPFTLTLPNDFATDYTIDFGYMSACAARIGDFVWSDTNANGIQDAGELGIPNVRVNLFDNLHVQIGTMLTAADGFYLFDGLCAGTYSVEVDTSTLPAGMLASPTLVGGNTATDSNPNPSTVTLANFSAQNLTIDFGYYPSNPSISLVKLTNGTDNNSPTGPLVSVGSTVTWTYRVGNPGNVPLSNLVVRDDRGTPANTADDFNATFQSGDTNANGLLDVSETWLFTASGTAVVGQYTNVARVVGTPPTGGQVSDTNPDNYFGARPAISLLKLTNGTNNDTPPGIQLAVGSTVTWSYVITNSGNVPLTNVTLADNKIGVITCPATTLAVGASMTCTATGIALAGQYTNVGTVTGAPPVGPNVSASNPDNYFGKQVPCGPCEGKVTELDLRYTGPVVNPIIIVASKQASKGVNVVVTPLGGGVYRLTSASSNAAPGFVGTLGTDITVTVKNAAGQVVHTTSIHTSCSQPIGPGLVSGHFVVVRGASKAGGELCLLPPPSPKPIPLTLSCPATTGLKGVYYSSALTRTGGVAPYVFSIMTGSLPGGLTLNATTGAITGTPTVTGTFNFTGKVVDSAGGTAATATATCRIVISHPPPPGGGTLVKGDTATIGYWQNKNGQALIKSMPNQPALANWLAGNFPKMFGDLAGGTNADVADYFVDLFNVTGTKTRAQIMATALAVYVTNSSLAGNTATSSGFNVSSTGTGAKVYNVGTYGAAIGLSNSTSYTVFALLKQAAARWPFDAAEFNALNNIFDGINVKGDR